MEVIGQGPQFVGNVHDIEDPVRYPAWEWYRTVKTPNLKNMKYLMTAAALCLGMMTAQAQTGKTAPMEQASRNCLATTTDKDWSSLDLSAEQMVKVKEIQGECMKVTDKMKADMMDTKSSPMLDKYEGMVKDVLTPGQYEQWVKQCSTHASLDNKTMEQEEPADDNN